MLLFSRKFYAFLFFLPVFVLLFICIFFIPVFSKDYSFSVFNSVSPFPTYSISSSGFCWPVPGYTTITSPYGRRISPTYGASSFHSGIDIAASPDSSLVATINGTISYTGFNGSGRIYNYLKK